jgi:hypothetical protein
MVEAIDSARVCDELPDSDQYSGQRHPCRDENRDIYRVKVRTLWVPGTVPDHSLIEVALLHLGHTALGRDAAVGPEEVGSTVDHHETLRQDEKTDAPECLIDRQ